MANQIIVVGDSHCHVEVLQRIIKAELAINPDTKAMLHCGDLGFYDSEQLNRLPIREQYLIHKHNNPIEQFQPYLIGDISFQIPLIAIPGNHEDFTLVRELQTGNRKVLNLKILSPGEIVSIPGTPFTLMGLGKILPIGLSEIGRKRESIIQPEDIELTVTSFKESPTILLLHDCPFIASNHDQRSYGHPEISRIIQKVKPRVVFAGHIHKAYITELNGIPIYGLGYGADGHYAVIDENLNVTFKNLEGETLQLSNLQAIDPSEIKFKSDKPLKKNNKSRERLLVAREIAQHFNLDIDLPKINETLAIISRKICDMQANKTISTKDQALIFAKEFLQNNNILDSEYTD